MSAEKLVTALRNLAVDMYNLREEAEGDGPTPKKLDHAGLALEVLAHIVAGKTVECAFGAPGDWGYGTAIGDGLRGMLREPREEGGAAEVTLDRAELVRALQTGNDALTDCLKYLLGTGPMPCPSFMATASGEVSRALKKAGAK